MRLEKLNAWLTFSGHLAVLIGLIALAIEIRGNTAAVRAQELGALQEQAQARQLASLDPAFAAAYVRSLYSPAELTLEELVRLVPFLSHWLSNLERTYQARLDGIVREADWQSQLLSAPVFFGSPFGQSVWAEIQGDFVDKPEFVRAINGALSSSPVVPDNDWYLQLQSRLQSLDDR